MKAVIITILIYSAVLTAVSVYKDSSSYFRMDELDAITGGPVMWLLLLVIAVFRPFTAGRKKKEKSYIPKSEAYIAKTVEKIIKHYRSQKASYGCYIDLSFRSGEFNCNDIEGWSWLEVNSPKYERLNRQFENLMFNDFERTAEELKKHLTRVDETYMKANGDSDYFIDLNRHRELYAADR